MWPTLGEWISENITRVIVRRVVAFLLALVAGVATSGSAWYLCLLLRDTAVEWLTWAWQTVWKWAKLVAFVIVSVVIGVAFFMEPFYANDALIDATLAIATNGSQVCYDLAINLYEMRRYFITVKEPTSAVSSYDPHPCDLSNVRPCQRYEGDEKLCLFGIPIEEACPHIIWM